jgi:hypothetical protein
MSGISKLLFGDKARDSQVVDTTASQFQNLRDPLMQQLLQQMSNPQRYTGPFTALMGQGEQNALANTTNAANQVGTGTMGHHALQTQADGATNPFAALSGLEQYGLGQVSQQAFGNSPLTNQTNQFLGQQLGGVMNPFAGAAGLGAGEQQGLNAIQQTAFGPQSQLQNTTNASLQQLAGSGGVHPQLEQLIGAATRPILENFGDEALAQRGLYTGAGQQVQGMGSSPFAQASARLASGTANAIGDTTANLTAQLNGQQQQAQLQALGMAQQQPGMQLQQQLAATQALGLGREVQQTGMNNQANAFNQMQQGQFTAAGLGDQFAGNSLQRALAGFQAAGTGAEREGAAYENAANRQLQAGSQLQSGQLASQAAQLQAQLQNLQAQGLPRMIEQLGIEGGLNQYNQQQQQMLQLLQLMGGITQAGTATTAGTQASTGLAGAFLSGFSDRRGKKDIQRAGTLANGVPVYRFRYLWQDADEPLRLGVMADEVEHIPGAVARTETGLAFVDYGKVMAYG